MPPIKHKHRTRKESGPYADFDTALKLAEQEERVYGGERPHPMVQSGGVYLLSHCGGCGALGVWWVDQVASWCPRCGGSGLVDGALELEHLPFENGMCRMIGSDVVHAIAPPIGEHPLCMPGAQVGRMIGVDNDAEINCQRCIAADGGRPCRSEGWHARRAQS